jgi:probable phosphoglycerate mutase
MEEMLAIGKLILVRHGETAANLRRVFADSDDIPLTDTGCLQSEQVAQRLAREFRPDVLVSSHFARARQTSEIIGRVLGLTPEAIAGIHERNFGDLRGHPYARLAEAPHSAETPDSVRRRAIAAINALRERYPAHEIVVVSHGAVIQSICAHITGVWSEASVPPNCGLVVIEYDDRGWHTPLLSGEWDQITRASSSVPDRRPS